MIKFKTTLPYFFLSREDATKKFPFLTAYDFELARRRVFGFIKEIDDINYFLYKGKEITPYIQIIDKKRCSFCRKIKPLSSFSKLTISICGLNSRCKNCKNNIQDIWRKNNFDKTKRYNLTRRERHGPRLRAGDRERRRRVRVGLIDMFGGKCVKCGFSDARALQIDHINGGGRKEFKQIGNHWRYYRMLLKRELDVNLYQLLCANCNWIKIEENGERNRK